MDFLRSIFNYILRLAGAYIKHEIDNTFRSPQQQRDFNPDMAFQTPKEPAPTHKRIVTSTDGRLAATCPAGWFSHTENEYLIFGTSEIAMHEGIGNIPKGEAAVHIEVIDELPAGRDVFEQIIRDRDTVVYAEANWSQPRQASLIGKEASMITGTSEYGDQVLILITLPRGNGVLVMVNTAAGEAMRFDAQYHEIAGSVIYQG